MKKGFLVGLLILTWSSLTWAGGVTAMRQNRQRQAQQIAIQREMIQRQVAARQAAAVQQAVRQQAARQVQAVAQQKARVQAQAVAHQVAERQAQAAVHRARVHHQVNVYQNLPKEIAVNIDVPVPVNGPTATLNEVVTALRNTSQDWSLIVDENAKATVVAQYIEEYRSQGVRINRAPLEYAQMIDNMSQSSPEMLTLPFSQVLKIVSIIQYDFNNGQDKDGMALQVLGTPEAVRQNKSRLGL